MSDMDINKLLKVLDKSSSERFLKLTSSKIKQIKNDLFQRLNFDVLLIKELHKKLKNYIFVDDLIDITLGRYIRWINLKDYDNIKLTNGGIICKIYNTDNSSGPLILCKNNYNNLFTIKMDECLIFKKLSIDELILIKTLDHINN